MTFDSRKTIVINVSKQKKSCLQKLLKNSQENLMKISDLNHIEAVEGTEVVGGTGGQGTSGKFDVNQNINLKFNEEVVKKFDIKFSNDDIDGNGSFADAKAYAGGKNSFTNLFTYTETEEGKYSLGESVSQSYS